MSNFKETLVTSTAQIDREFAACPDLYNTAHSAFKIAAAAFVGHGIKFEIVPPRRGDSAGWCDPVVYVVFPDGTKRMILTEVKPAASGRYGWSEAAAIYVDCDGRKRFPQRKDNTFNVDAITETLIAQAKHLAAQRDAVAAQKAADELAKDVRTANGLSDYSEVVFGTSHAQSGNKFHTHPAQPGKVFVRISTQLTPDDAAKLIAAARELGINLR